MEVFVFIGVIVVVILLGRYAISEGQRLESQKRGRGHCKENQEVRWWHSKLDASHREKERWW